jgi:hypothetical protein
MKGPALSSQHLQQEYKVFCFFFMWTMPAIFLPIMEMVHFTEQQKVTAKFSF